MALAAWAACGPSLVWLGLAWLSLAWPDAGMESPKWSCSWKLAMELLLPELEAIVAGPCMCWWWLS